MNRDSLKKNMLLKKKNGNADVNGDSEIKESISTRITQIFRVLTVEEEKVLVIDCIKKTMPVWVETGKLDDFEEDSDFS